MTDGAVVVVVRMPGTDGIAALASVLRASPATRVVMLTTFDIDSYVYDSLRGGASAFLVKDVPPERLLSDVRAVMRGDMLVAPSITRRLVEDHVRRLPRRADDARRLASLTDRERDVLAEVARGLSNVEIGARLHVSEGTVKTHVSRLLAKLCLRDRVQAVIAAYELGFVQPGGRETGPARRRRHLGRVDGCVVARSAGGRAGGAVRRCRAAACARAATATWRR